MFETLTAREIQAGTHDLARKVLKLHGMRSRCCNDSTKHWIGLKVALLSELKNMQLNSLKGSGLWSDCTSHATSELRAGSLSFRLIWFILRSETLRPRTPLCSFSALWLFGLGFRLVFSLEICLSSWLVWRAAHTQSPQLRLEMLDILQISQVRSNPGRGRKTTERS